MDIRKARDKVSRSDDMACDSQRTWQKARRNGVELTWHDITRIHGVLVLDEPEAIHQLDLHDLTGAMGVEVILDIGLGSCD